MALTLARPALSRTVLAISALALASAPADAQAPRDAQPPRGTIAGEVVDAGNLQPLRAATVVLLPGQGGVLPPVVSTSSSFASQARVVITSESGSYRFDDLPVGAYQLRVQRVGYKPVTLDVDLRGSGDARLSVGLTVAPIRLTPLTVRADMRPPYGRTEAATADEESSRIGAALLRQRLFLGTDVREVTHPDVMEAVTLGSTDFFRAFHRLPGVATRDDDAAELWTRGSRPDLTRIYFDGLPLLSSLHSFGLLSGIGTSSVGAAFLHPGVRPASIGEGAAAIVDVRSRPGGGTGAIRVITELTSGPSLFASSSARAALDQRILDGRGAWMLAGGRSILDLIRDESGGTNAVVWPAYFADLTGRFDLDMGAGRRLEASALWLRDLRRDKAEARPFAKKLAWGSDLGRATVTWPIGRFQSRHTIGASRFVATIDTMPTTIDSSSPAGSLFWSYQRALRELPLRSSVLHASLSGEVEPLTREGDPPRWTLGYELTAREVDLDGDMRFALTRIQSTRSRRTQSSPAVSLWGTIRVSPTARLRIEPGLRVDIGPAPSNAGTVRAMPRLQARFAIDSQTALSAGVGRSIQYAQSIGRIERSFDGVTFPPALWLAADDSLPALHVDIATVGVERWLSASWLAAANVFHRRSTGLLLRDPRPGRLLERGSIVDGREEASGLEVSTRKLAGRVTGSASYTYTDARTTAAGLVFPSSQDRPHSFDVTLLARLKRSAQLSVAYTYATGAPFTRLRSARGSLDDPFAFDREPADSLSADDPNADRMPPYASLDLALEWMFDIGTARISPYFQVQNVLRHRNFGPYAEPVCRACGDGFFFRHQTRLRPTIGIRARF
jgi:hypothetical protein